MQQGHFIRLKERVQRRAPQCPKWERAIVESGYGIKQLGADASVLLGLGNQTPRSAFALVTIVSSAERKRDRSA
jgi:hypothetical protein